MRTSGRCRRFTRRPPRARRSRSRERGAGKQVYYKYSCNSCHGDTGLGLYDLRRAWKKYPTDAELIAYIKDPSAKVPGIKMPTWEGVSTRTSTRLSRAT